MAFIRFKEVSKEYHTGGELVKANDCVSFDIQEGDLVVILGQSGAGKSTVLNLLAAMDQPTSGEIWVDGQEISQLKPKERTLYRRHKVGFVFQSYNLIKDLTAIENVALTIDVSGPAMTAQSALEAVGLADRAKHFPDQLSGGEQQRVSIARAIAGRNRLILCDEPTAALDSKTADKILSLLQAINRQESKTLIIVTHNPAIADLADLILELRDGKLFKQERPSDLIVKKG